MADFVTRDVAALSTPPGRRGRQEGAGQGESNVTLPWTTPQRCPDGSWSKWLSRRCVLPFMHTGPHRYEMHVIQERSDD